MLEPASLGLDSAQKHRREEERHQGCSKIPDDEPGCNIQHQDVAEIEEEKGMIGLEKPHLLHSRTELTEIFHQLFILAGLKAGLIWCQFPNQERAHVLPYQCLVKMKSNERILKHRQRNRMEENQVAAKEIYSIICWTIQKIPVREISYFYYLNVMSISMATR